MQEKKGLEKDFLFPCILFLSLGGGLPEGAGHED